MDIKFAATIRSIRGVGRYEILVEHIIKPLLKSVGAIFIKPPKSGGARAYGDTLEYLSK